MSGRKDDAEKDPWHLAPWDAFRAIVKVLAYGAEKYTQKTTLSERGIVQWWADYLVRSDRAPVIRIAVDTTGMEGVGRVTSAICDFQIQRSQSDNGKTVVNGKREILTRSWSWLQEGVRTQRQERATQLPIDGGLSEKLALLWKNLKPYEGSNKVHAPSVDGRFAKSEPNMSITAILPDGSEESFAVVATTVWGCLRIASKNLELLFPTWSAPRLLILETPQSLPGSLSVSGARNWEKGMSWSRHYSALMRHMIAWWEGEPADPESGYSHLWHAGACAVFLIAYELRGAGTDDRPGADR